MSNNVENKVGYYEDKIVAFVDILGFSSLIAASKCDDEKAKKLHNVLKFIMNLKKENEDSESLPLKEFGKEVTVFSDSAVISYSKEIEGGLFYIILDLIHLQINLFQLGVILRGGVSFGKVYHDGNLVYGPAMLEAYELESKKAINPRIILTEDTIKNGIKFSCSKQHAEEDEEKYIKDLLKLDSDKTYYSIDILRQEEELGDEYLEFLYIVRDFIVKQKEKNKDVDRVLEKYEWLEKYFNEVVTEKFGEDLRN